MGEILGIIFGTLMFIVLLSAFIGGWIEAFAQSRGAHNKKLEQEYQERMNQLEAEYKQRNESLDAREAAIIASEQRNALWMDSFESDGSDIQNRIAVVDQLRKEIEACLTQKIDCFEKLNSQRFPSPSEFHQIIRSAICSLKEQKSSLLLYTQDLAGYLRYLERRETASPASSLPSEERRHYEAQIEKLNEELKEPTYFKNLFTYALKRMEREGDKLFYNYPSVRDFYKEVTDKRFHRAMTEDISISGMIQIKATICSAGTYYTTTLQSCTCPDHHAPCKHMMFLAYHTGVLLLNKEKLEASIQQYIEELKKNKTK